MLEERIAELNATMEKHNALLEKMIANSGGKAAAAAAPPEKPAKSEKPAAKPKAAKEPTEEEVREKFGGFFNLEKDKGERKRLVQAIGPILEHFGVTRITEVSADQRAEAIGYANTLIQAHELGGVDAVESAKLPFMSEDEAGEEDEGESVL